MRTIVQAVAFIVLGGMIVVGLAHMGEPQSQWLVCQRLEAEAVCQ